MARSLNLASALAKYERAVQHAERLKADIAWWANSEAHPPVNFRPKFHSKDHRVAFWIKGIHPPKPSWGLVFGDAIHNLRASLDHIAWEMVRASGVRLSERAKEGVQFPICAKDRAAYEALCQSRRLPGVSGRRIRLLSPFQPYEGRLRQGRELLWLARLDNDDKHRELQPVLVRPHRYDLVWEHGLRVSDIRIERAAWALETETEAVSALVEPWPHDSKPRVEVKFDAARQVTLEDPPFPNQIGMLEAWDLMQSYVERVLRKVLSP